jgi:hypothetical protein
MFPALFAHVTIRLAMARRSESFPGRKQDDDEGCVSKQPITRFTTDGMIGLSQISAELGKQSGAIPLGSTPLTTVLANSYFKQPVEQTG